MSCDASQSSSSATTTTAARAASLLSSKEATIFVSIISYRDCETVHTLTSLFSRASHPSRLRVGVVWQYDPEHDSSLLFSELDLSKFPPNCVRQLFMHASQAQGPCYARYLAQKYLYGGGGVSKLWNHQSQQRGQRQDQQQNARDASMDNESEEPPHVFKGEDFYLQIDSHMRFVQGWDEMLIDEWMKCSDPKAVLSTYPEGYERNEQAESSGSHAAYSSSSSSFPPLLCASHFDAADGMLRFVGRLLSPAFIASRRNSSDTSEAKPIPSLFVAAGFLFSRGELIQDVPYDGLQRNLFFGEELSFLARLYTSGYNLYSPTRTIVRHCWSREYRPNFRELRKTDPQHAAIEHTSKERVWSLLGMPFIPFQSAASSLSSTKPSSDKAQATHASSVNDSDTSKKAIDFGIFGLGSVRTLAQFESHIGVSLSARSMMDDGSRAKNGGLQAKDFLAPSPATPAAQQQKKQTMLALDLVQQFLKRQ